VKRYETNKKGLYKITDDPGDVYTLVYSHSATTSISTHDTLSGFQKAQFLNVVLASPKAVTASASLAQRRVQDIKRVLVLVEERDAESVDAESLMALRKIVSSQLKLLSREKFAGLTGTLIHSEIDQLFTLDKRVGFKKFGALTSE
jgi:hypothetical protein